MLLWVIPIIVAMLDIKIKFLEVVFIKNNSKPITCQRKLYVLLICSQTKKCDKKVIVLCFLQVPFMSDLIEELDSHVCSVFRLLRCHISRSLWKTH